LISGDSQKAGRVMGAMMTMKKVDIQALKDAAAG
jgi:predicted 3-demethylubiquinone-9 3-methyltransferase (glyoxalase superfamily)